MTACHDNRSPGGTREKIDTSPWLAVLVAMAAFFARLPALGAWWNQDDWGLLARAAGLIESPGLPIRYLSRDLYWQAFWPLAGLNPDPYAVSRLVLHGVAAAGVVRLAMRLGLSPLQGMTAGLIMAASPLAFTPLYWASGVQDLLAVVCAVWALERWLAPGHRARLAAVVLALAAMGSKEVVVGLPLLFALLTGRRPGRDGILIAVVTMAAVAAALLAVREFATATDQPYALGGLAPVYHNLATYGWWLVLPGPAYPPAVNGAAAMAGAAVWILWGAWSWFSWRRGRRVPLFTLVGALVMLAPVLPLARHLAPDLAYPVEPFGCLALASLLPARWPIRPVVVAAATLAAVAWGLLGMRARLDLRLPDGRLADPVVRRTAVSWQACRQLEAFPVADKDLVIVQPPLVAETAAMAAELGEEKVLGSTLYHSLDGALGPRMVLEPGRRVIWANGLRLTPMDAHVLLDAGDVLRPWGPTSQALLNQVLTDVGLGFFERGRLHLLRASLLAGESLTIVYDPDLLPVSLDQVLANKEDFIDYLAAGRRNGRSAMEIGGLQKNFFRLLSACTGLDVESLRAPSANGAESP